MILIITIIVRLDAMPQEVENGMQVHAQRPVELILDPSQGLPWAGKI
jgi:hypothetical protein